MTYTYKVTTCYEDAEYRVLVYDYTNGAGPDLYLDWADDDGDWSEQVPLPLTHEKAIEIAKHLMAWAEANTPTPTPTHAGACEAIRQSPEYQAIK
jgi:hypothetical protein